MAYHKITVQVPRGSFAAFWSTWHRHPLSDHAIFDARLSGKYGHYDIHIQIPEDLATLESLKRAVQDTFDHAVPEEEIRAS